MRQGTSLFFCCLFFSFVARAQLLSPGPRITKEKPVRLIPVPLDASLTEIQTLLTKNHYLYFKPGSYNIGTLRISDWQSGLIWGAGRLTTTLQGNIIVSDSRNVTIGNFNLVNNATKENSVIDVIGRGNNDLVFMNALVSGGKDGTAIRLKAPGQFIIQGCNLKSSDIGLSIEHSRAIANVFGGNMQYNHIHIQQINGHLDARAFGMQGIKGDADIVINSPSPSGYHLIEGLRSEGSNGANGNEVLLSVPQTEAPINVALRANTLGSMARYADYNAAGNLLLLENANYPGPEDKSSVGVVAHNKRARVISMGNKYGLSYDAAPGPFVIDAGTTVQSAGDLWMLPNKNDYSKSFNEPITKEAMLAAGKIVPDGVSFFAPSDAVAIQLPEFSDYKLAALPRIANLSELMLNVKDFGALPNDGKDDHDAIQKALDAAEKSGVYKPLYFPAGKYELATPLFLDHQAGGGFWGEGADASLLVSTSGKGVIASDGVGYAVFADIGFVNGSGADTKTTDFDWTNTPSQNKALGKTGAALQANMFYRCRFENGRIGMSVGAHQMGDGFMMVDCVFRNQQTTKGEGSAYSSENFNVLTNPLVHCLFEKVDCAVSNNKGSFNFYGNKLSNIDVAALKFYTVVSNGFAIVNNEMDTSPVPFVFTGHSSAKAHLLIERTKAEAPASIVPASTYNLGGSVMFLHCSFPSRIISNGGSIGDNSLFVYETNAADIKANGRAHRYLINATKKRK